MGDDKIGYSRALDARDPGYILRRNGGESPLLPPSLDHDGIENHFLEKGSTIWYWRDGQWFDLPGLD